MTEFGPMGCEQKSCAFIFNKDEVFLEYLAGSVGRVLYSPGCEFEPHIRRRDYLKIF